MSCIRVQEEAKKKNKQEKKPGESCVRIAEEEKKDGKKGKKDPQPEKEEEKEPHRCEKDPFIKSKKVCGLTPDEFQCFIQQKDLAMIMFYLPEDPTCDWTRRHFKKAADTTERKESAYAAVDCSKYASLCMKEGVSRYPVYKIYHKGRLFSTIDDARHFLFNDMRAYMELKWS